MTDFTYKEKEYIAEEEFPKREISFFLQTHLNRLKNKNPHQAILNVLEELISGSLNYQWLYETFSEKKLSCNFTLFMFLLFCKAFIK